MEVSFRLSELRASVVDLADESVDLLSSEGKGAADLEHGQEDVLRRSLDLLDSLLHLLLEFALGVTIVIVGIGVLRSASVLASVLASAGRPSGGSWGSLS